MIVVTIDSKRRITLPRESGIKPGQQVSVVMVGQHLEIIPLTVIPTEVFETAMQEIGETHAETFRRLANQGKYDGGRIEISGPIP